MGGGDYMLFVDVLVLDRASLAHLSSTLANLLILRHYITLSVTKFGNNLNNRWLGECHKHICKLLEAHSTLICCYIMSRI